MAEVTLGGDRLGSGNKQKVELHNYHMSSFNLEQDFKSTLAPGILYPFLKIVGTNHGTFDIDLDAFIRTLPTNGPLFGSFKMQADIFASPIRLYQGILHNNPVDIGLHMDQVYLPKIKVSSIDGEGAPRVKGADDYDYQINNSSLLKYLGVSGMGTYVPDPTNPTGNASRKFNAVPILAYYDIFKNYYSNKQEENAYVITPGTAQEINVIDSIAQGMYTDNPETIITEYNPYNGQNFIIETDNNFSKCFEIKIEIPEGKPITEESALELLTASDILYNENETSYLNPQPNTDFNYTINYIPGTRQYQISIRFKDEYVTNSILEELGNTVHFKIEEETGIYQADIKLQEFPLKNIDKMRHLILSKNELGDQVTLGETTGSDILPYSALTSTTSEGITWNAFELNGLLLKTYQSDMFNNWLNTETIDLITQMTTMDTTNGFTMDDLNFMEKAYNVLTRIGINGGTYEDWQEAVYGEGAIRKAETPMYVGGMSSEIMFEEVIATSESNADQYQALGALAGKGTQVNKHGGRNIHIKCEEPCYIIGIVSLTPRISYSQGNDWDMTDLDSLDDLHKPGFDGIGFQDLMIEQMAWWNTLVKNDTVISRQSAGKQTAWIQYQTAIDKVYGDFAKQDGKAFMVLNRNYERKNMSEASGATEKREVLDLTTYIDPAKYNYAFAYTDLAAQNFWAQVHSRVIARRKMAAQQIPNL